MTLLNYFMGLNSLSGGSEPTPPSFRDTITFSLRGQSNAAGRADSSLLPAADQEPQENIYIRNELSIVNYQVGAQYGVELFLAQKLRDYHNKPVLIDKYGVSGTVLYEDPNDADWNVNSAQIWPTSKTYYEVTESIAPSYKLEILNNVFIWFQGESDSVYEDYANAYQVNEFDMFSNLLSINPVGYKIIDILTASDYGDYAAGVRAGKTTNSGLLGTDVSLDSNNYSKSDGTHLDQQGYRDLAEDIFQIIKDYWTF